MKTEPESKRTKKFYEIGHFRVPKTLTFKMRLGAQSFFWKWVLFAWEWKMISISKGWAPTLVLTQRPGGTRNWPLRRRFLRSNAVVSRSCFELMLWMNNSSKKIDREVIQKLSSLSLKTSKIGWAHGKIQHKIHLLWFSLASITNVCETFTRYINSHFLTIE